MALTVLTQGENLLNWLPYDDAITLIGQVCIQHMLCTSKTL